ncbi:MAG: hypothetical protein SangKO_084500 [Sandaracinaceae bacterium]
MIGAVRWAGALAWALACLPGAASAQLDAPVRLVALGSSLCHLTPSRGAVRCVSPGGDAVESSESGFSGLGVNGRSLCALRDRQVFCGRSADALRAVEGLDDVERLDGAHAVRADGALLDRLSTGGRADADLAPATDVAVGRGFGCAVTLEGTVRCRGGNRDGSLGRPSPRYSAEPLPVPGVRSVREVVAGSHHACALHRDGTVTCWGDGEALGSRRAGRRPPTRVRGLRDVAALSASDDSTCALTAAGAVRCWGANPRGAIAPVSERRVSRPRALDGVDDAVSALRDGHRTCVLSRDGSLRCMGRRMDRPAAPVVSLPPVASVTANDETSCAVTPDGDLWCWGRLGDRAHVSPTRVARSVASVALATLPVARYPTESGGPCVVRRDGSAACLRSAEPLRWEDLGLQGVAELAIGAETTCARLRDRSVRCRGSNDFGALGVGGRAERSDEWVRPDVEADRLVTDGRAMCSLSGGEVTCWGLSRSEGRIHLRTSRAAPQRESLPRARVLIGGRHLVLVVTDGGDLVVWRRGEEPTRLSTRAPTDGRIATRHERVCVTAGGRVRCEHIRRSRAEPTTIATFEAAPEGLALGTDHGCAILSGEARCWGSGRWGQLGDGSGPGALGPF